MTSTKTLLYQENTKEDQIRIALKERGRTEEDLEEYIKSIQDWLKCQQHLPEIPNRDIIICFIFMNKFSVERAKQRLDMYYSIKTIIPELFEKKNPKLPQIKDSYKGSYGFPLPKLTKEGYRISVFKNFLEPEKFDPYCFYAHAFNIAEIRMQEDICLGEVIIMDYEGFEMGHFMKVTPMYVKRTYTVLEQVFGSPMKALHYINCPPYAEKLISLIKQLIKPKLAQRIHTHKGSELVDFIDPELLPIDFGGKQPPLAELHALWGKKLAEYQERFDELDKMKTKEELRPSPLVNDEILGFHGNFKKLDVD